MNAIGLPTRLLRHMQGPAPGPVVLMYHALDGDDRAPARWSVSARSFALQMQYLADEGWHTRRVRDLCTTERLPEKTVVVTFDDGYADNYAAGFCLLARLGFCATWFIVTANIGQTAGWSDPGLPRRRLLEAAQLREMNSAGMEIGAHSRHHADLTALTPAALREEVHGARTELAQILAHDVASFAYPYGRYGAAAVAAVGAAGYERAVTTRTGFVLPAAARYELPRVGVFGSDSLACFARKLALAHTEVAWHKLAGRGLGRIRKSLRATAVRPRGD